MNILNFEKDIYPSNLCVSCDRICITNPDKPYIRIPGVFSNNFVNYNESFMFLHICHKCYNIYEEYIDNLRRIYFKGDMFDVIGFVLHIV